MLNVPPSERKHIAFPAGLRCAGAPTARWVPGPRLGEAPEDQQRAQLQFIFIFCLYINAFST